MLISLRNRKKRYPIVLKQVLLRRFSDFIFNTATQELVFIGGLTLGAIGAFTFARIYYSADVDTSIIVEKHNKFALVFRINYFSTL